MVSAISKLKRRTVVWFGNTVWNDRELSYDFKPVDEFMLFRYLFAA
jgi:hypothetical protein